MTLKRILAALAAIAFAACAAHSQTVEFELKPSHSTYVTGEPIDFTVRLANVGSTPVVIDDAGPYAGNRLWLEVTTQNGVVVESFAKPDLAASLMLMPGEAFVEGFEVTDWFPILRQGRYYLRARMLHDGRRYETNLKLIDVVPGLELASATEPVPGRPGHLREVHLVYLAREQREFAFLRCFDDGDAQSTPTLRLGPIVRVTKPTLSIDSDGSIIVRHQSTRNRFQETRVLSEADGLRVERESQNLDSKITPLINALTAPDAAAAPAADRQDKSAPRSPRRRPARPADGW